MQAEIFRETRLRHFHVCGPQSIALLLFSLLLFSLLLSSSGCGVPELPQQKEARAPEPIYPAENAPAGSSTKTEAQPPATEKAASRSGNTTKDNTVKDNTVKDNTVKDSTVKDSTVKDNTTTGKTTTKGNTVKGNTVKGNTVKGNTVKGNTVKAEPGSGKWQPGKAGFLMTPINAYFSTKEKLALMQVEDGLKKFRALKGRKPKDFQEVQKEILKPAAIKLPELKPGETYFFDASKGPNGTLMVRKAE